MLAMDKNWQVNVYALSWFFLTTCCKKREGILKNEHRIMNSVNLKKD
jgi:hypothetical protein